MRDSTIRRTTAETDIRLTLNLDGSGQSDVQSGIGFLDHMLTLFARHGRFDLTLRCAGDTEVDGHHSAEDIGICLGQAFKEALGDKRGITRYGDTALPMDEALILTAADLSGRSGFFCELSIPSQKVGDFDTELVEEFWTAFVRSGELTLHIRQLAGRNSHHIIEGVFKSAARTLRKAVALDPDLEGEVPSTKGVL
ncbi:MAG: imidazoleglycerol-phosphate dehydratase HisB [Oscillospiraceae bacterium]|nr:imidazoleglycerol-phosphate dehydratase HisB [Oscillospiraceae bacterium]